MIKQTISTIIISIIAISGAFAEAKKGSFNEEIIFNGSKRQISCYVPETYNKPTLLIGLHGAGDNSKSYSSVMISQYKIQSIFDPNTIFIFPDGGDDQSKDYYYPDGDEAIIDSVISWAKANYGVEEGNVYLQGFSLGGRSALKWGLDNPSKIKGLILNTPAVQSPLDVQNIQGRSLMFNYQNANKIRIGMIHGTKDSGFYFTDEMLADSLVFNDANLFYFKLPEMAHSLPPLKVEEILAQYVSNKITKEAIKVHSLLMEPYYTSENLKFKALIHNYSNIEVNDFKVKVNFQNKDYEFAFSNKIKTGKHLEVLLPFDYTSLNLQSGHHKMEAWISELNGKALDKHELMNQREEEFHYFGVAKEIPFYGATAEKNELMNNWSIKPSGNFLSWFAAVGFFDNAKVPGFVNLNTLLAYDNYGLVESLYSNIIDYSKAKRPVIAFDVAYNYSHYSTAYFNPARDFMDTLQISISNDNGKTFKPIFKKWGKELQTYMNVFTDITNIQNYIVAPKEGEWKYFNIDLSNEKVSDKTQFRFDVISGSGSLVILKNIKFYDASSGVEMPSNANVAMLYPNPANKVINLPENVDLKGNNMIRIFNEAGVNVLNSDYKTQLNIESLPVGNYFITYGNNQSKFSIIR